eukprot:5600084-Prymnesium_polylepis.1
MTLATPTQLRAERCSVTAERTRLITCGRRQGPRTVYARWVVAKQAAVRTQSGSIPRGSGARRCIRQTLNAGTRRLAARAVCEGRPQLRCGARTGRASNGRVNGARTIPHDERVQSCACTHARGHTLTPLEAISTVTADVSFT